MLHFYIILFLTPRSLPLSRRSLRVYMAYMVEIRKGICVFSMKHHRILIRFFCVCMLFLHTESKVITKNSGYVLKHSEHVILFHYIFFVCVLHSECVLCAYYILLLKHTHTESEWNVL